ncbi:MAG: hypothetical protein GQ567_01130 [Methanosarcinales archaeon]|nr:hypothetical protein [Methanosarcinales archaeon]
MPSWSAKTTLPPGSLSLINGRAAFEKFKEKPPKTTSEEETFVMENAPKDGCRC